MEQDSHEKGLDEELAASGAARTAIFVGLHMRHDACKVDGTGRRLSDLIKCRNDCAAGFQARHQAALDRFNLEASSESGDSDEDDLVAADGCAAKGPWPATADEHPAAAAHSHTDVSAPFDHPRSSTGDLRTGSPTGETAVHLASACRVESDSDAGLEDVSTSASDRDAEDASIVESASQGPPRVQDRVRRRVTEQRQNAARRGAMAHASRNAQKAVSRKGRNDVNASRLLG